MRGDRSLVIGCMLMVLASTAAAQVLEPPPRPHGGLFGGRPAPDPKRTHQELTLEGSLLGGYDDNVAPPTGGDAVTLHPSGYIGFGDGRVRYWIGKDARSMELSGRAYMNTYRNAGVGPSYGGEQRVRVRTALGRRTQLEAAQDLGYVPYISLGLFGAAQRDAGAQNPERHPTEALTESGSWMKGGSASLVRKWGRRTSTNVGYVFSTQTYVNSVRFDSRMHLGSIGLDQSIGRTATIRATYQHSDNEFNHQDGRTFPLLNRTIDLGFHYQRRLSRTRQLSFSGGAGVTYVDTVEQSTKAPLQFWRPSGYGTVHLDVGRAWSLAGDYKQSISVLQGVAPEAFVTRAGIISAGGLLRPWLESVFTAGYSNGLAGERGSDRFPGSYDGYTGTAQLRVRLTRWWSSVVSFNRFQYRLNPEASHSLGVAPELHRNGVRVGFAWLLPLYGSSVEHRGPLSGPRN